MNNSLGMKWYPSMWKRTDVLGTKFMSSILSVVSGFSREIEQETMDRHTERFITGIGLYNWSLRSPIICLIHAEGQGKLEVYSSSPSPKAWVPEAPTSEGVRWMSQLNQGANLHFFHFVLLRLSLDCVMPAHNHEAIFFTQFIYSNANLFLKHPHRHVQKKCLPATWASLSIPIWEHPLLFEGALSPAS